MSVKIRLAQAGSRKKVLYRIVAADSRRARDGRFLEKLGTYDPHTKAVMLDKEAAQKWLDDGAQPSDTVLKLLIKEGFKLDPPFFIPKKKVEPVKEAKAVEPAKEEAAPVKEEAKAAEPAKEEAAPAEEPAKEEAVKGELRWLRHPRCQFDGKRSLLNQRDIGYVFG